MASFQQQMFRGVEPEEYREIIACGGIRTVAYPRGAVLFHTGDLTRELGILLAGNIHIESIDLWGNRMILSDITPGQSFAETYAFCGAPLMVDVTAVQDSQVLFVHLGILLAPDKGDRPWYGKLLYNLLMLSTQKNLVLSNRVFCISSKHIRTRVMTYLSAQAVKWGQTEFTIPFDRQQMADYLNVERSALSKELGRMQKEGILSFHKNRFCLHRLDGGEGDRTGQ